jgi:hypothetical protein
MNNHHPRISYCTAPLMTTVCGPASRDRSEFADAPKPAGNPSVARLRSLLKQYIGYGHPFFDAPGGLTSSLFPATFVGWGKKLQIPPLRSPGFPVEFSGFRQLHAVFFTESRTRGHR